jgi:hypothetical protein
MAVRPSAVAVIINILAYICVSLRVFISLSLIIIPNTKMVESTEFIIEISTNIPAIKKVRLCSGKYSRKTNNEVKTLN